MPYQKKQVNAFAGLNAALRPELIDDAEASNISNYRHDKAGYLVNRNGVKAYRVEVPTATPRDAFGVFGISEFVLKDAWSAQSTDIEPYDDGGTGGDYEGARVNPTDRFMVYAVRTSTKVNGGDDANLSIPYEGAYVLSPLGGNDVDGGVPWRNEFWFMPNGTGAVPLGKDEYYNPNVSALTQVVAPSRNLYAHNTFIYDDTAGATGAVHVKDTNWIEHYVTMNQYRNVLVIADRTNGDLVLYDTYNDVEVQSDRQHAFRLRGNALTTFNPDTVIFDFGLGSDPDDFNAEGVQSGMAMYRFFLPKSRTTPPNDKYRAYLHGLDESPSWADDRVDTKEWFPGYNPAFMFAEMFRDPEYHGGGLLDDNEGAMRTTMISSDLGYSFSNQKTPKDYIDLFGVPSLYDPNMDQAQKDLVGAPADVYVWQDFELPYYPCNGLTSTSGNYLRDLDRFWDRSSPGPKTIKLKTFAGVEQEVPLGVWAYRFVWDMGNGEFSSPTSAVLVPDMLFSAVQDAAFAAPPAYERPYVFEGAAEFAQTGVNVNNGAHDFINEVSQGWVDPPVDVSGLALFDSSGTLTAFGDLMTRLKSELYDTGHRFRPAATTTLLDKGELSVVLTLHAQHDYVDCDDQVFGEAGVSIVEDLADAPDNDTYESLQTFKKGLRIPLFRKDSDSLTYNSVFDDEGNLRMAWRNEEQDTIDTTPPPPDTMESPRFRVQYQIAHHGVWGLGSDIDRDSGEPLWNHDLAETPDPYWLNIVPIQGVDVAGPWDMNNAPGADGNTFDGGALFNTYRAPQFMRAVQSDADRLLYVRSGVPAEVRDRLLMTGNGEIRLVKVGDYGTLSTADGLHLLPAGYTPDEQQGFNHDDERVGTVIRLEAGDTTVVGDTAIHPIAMASPTVTAGANPWYNTGDTYRGPVVKYYGPYDDGGGLADQTVTQCIFDNLEVNLVMNGERLLAVEQLTSYFPASLLFKAPRVKIKIDKDAIPSRAKRLLIFRSRPTHDNAWDALQFGEVEKLDVQPGVNDVEFLDDVKIEDVDFSRDPQDFEGITTPLKSRFNIAINERMFYGNFIETYQPLATRGRVANLNYGSPSSMSHSWNYSLFDGAGTEVGPVPLTGLSVQYRLSAIDGAGVRGATSSSGAITMGTKEIVALQLAPYVYTEAIDDVQVHRKIGSGDWEFIGTLDDDSEGIFVDNGLTAKAVVPTTISPSVELYESGLRYSEPYQPTFTKLDSFYEVRAGDGDQITGLDTLYGNLIVSKERSLHRLAVQGAEIPVSRVDEISNNIGCIAPNARIVINNEYYFLSWSGFYKYNNNILQKADGKFGEELALRLRSEQDGRTNPAIRDASCAYNATYHEIYLNIPVFTRELEAGEAGEPLTVNDNLKAARQRVIDGHIYVLNLDSQLVTKFTYMRPYPYTDATRPPDEPRLYGRLYHTNTLGELRSAEILPSGSFEEGVEPGLSAVYLEAPTDNADADEFIYYDTVTTDFIEPPDATASKDVHSFWHSKHFTGEDKTLIKRVRKVFAYLQGDDPTISGYSHASPHGVTQADSDGTARWSYTYVPTRGEFEAIPAEALSSGKERGERVSFQLDTDGASQIEYFGFYWRPMNAYER